MRNNRDPSFLRERHASKDYLKSASNSFKAFEKTMQKQLNHALAFYIYHLTCVVTEKSVKPSKPY